MLSDITFFGCFGLVFFIIVLLMRPFIQFAMLIFYMYIVGVGQQKRVEFLEKLENAELKDIFWNNVLHLPLDASEKLKRKRLSYENSATAFLKLLIPGFFASIPLVSMPVFCWRQFQEEGFSVLFFVLLGWTVVIEWQFIQLIIFVNQLRKIHQVIYKKRP